MAAKSPTLADIRLNRLHVYIDTDQEYFEAAVRVRPAYEWVKLMSQRMGAVPIGKINAGAIFDGEILLMESVYATFAKVMGTSSNLALAIGVQIGTFPVRLHDPADGATTTNDLYIPKCAFGVLKEIENDGKKERILAAAMEGMYDATAGGGWKLYGA